MILHHASEELLLALAAGRLPAGPALVVGAHVENCVQCRGRLETLESIGGALLETVEPHPLEDGAIAATLRRIAQEAPSAGAVRGAFSPPADPSPANVSWPASLQGCRAAPWRWIGPGRRLSRVQVPGDPQASVFLLRIEPGRTLPWHRHGKLELTQVLCGAFSDGRSTFRAGDFDEADGGVHHEPVAEAGSACVCLTWVEGRLQFDGRVAAAMARWLKV